MLLVLVFMFFFAFCHFFSFLLLLNLVHFILALGCIIIMFNFSFFSYLSVWIFRFDSIKKLNIFCCLLVGVSCFSELLFVYLFMWNIFQDFYNWDFCINKILLALCSYHAVSNCLESRSHACTTFCKNHSHFIAIRIIIYDIFDFFWFYEFFIHTSFTCFIGIYISSDSCVHESV